MEKFKGMPWRRPRELQVDEMVCIRKLNIEIILGIFNDISTVITHRSRERQ
jgi:hypothetical protein